MAQAVDKKDVGTALCDYFLHCENDSLDISISGVDERGQLTFSFPVSNIKDEKVIRMIGLDGSGFAGIGFFFTDMMGNLIVRQNIRKFWDFFVGMSDSDYSDKVLKYDHVHFGSASNGRFITMVFHCSLLYDIFIRMVDNCTPAEKPE